MDASKAGTFIVELKVKEFEVDHRLDYAKGEYIC
jgi:hypothetical protein